MAALCSGEEIPTGRIVIYVIYGGGQFEPFETVAKILEEVFFKHKSRSAVKVNDQGCSRSRSVIKDATQNDDMRRYG